MNCILNLKIARTSLIGAVVGAALAAPAFAERSCAAQATSSKPLSVKARAASAAKVPVVVVSGGGRGLLTDPDAAQSSLQFEIFAAVRSDGTAKGQASFVFPEAFALKWGPIPGVEMTHLKGDITTASVEPDGTVLLSGPFVETDYSRGEGIVYQEDSRQSGAAPMQIAIPPGGQKFTLTWCAFIPPNGTGVFSIEVTNGNLKVR